MNEKIEINKVDEFETRLYLDESKHANLIRSIIHGGVPLVVTMAKQLEGYSLSERVESLSEQMQLSV